MIEEYTADCHDLPTEKEKKGNGEDKAVIQADFMAIRRRLLPLFGDPVALELEVGKIHAETGVPIRTVRECTALLKKEREEREKGEKETRRLAEAKRLPVRQAWEENLLYTKDGEIKDCPYNAITILKNHPEWNGRIRVNLLRGETEIDGSPLVENDVASVMEWLGRGPKMAVRNVKTVHLALVQAGSGNAYNPVVDWLEGLPPWDGVERVSHLFSDFLGAVRTAYTTHVAKALLCGLIQRAYEPGSIMRLVPILEGPERIGKSLFVRDLGAPWSAEISANVENGKQVQEDIRGVWCAELMEMDALRKASESRIKAFISQRNDRYRAAYGMLSEDHPRVTVFVGTVNPNQAGSLFSWDNENTRFYPVVMVNYARAGFLAARDQLFAEAKCIYAKEKESWWEELEEVRSVASELRNGRAEIDPWFSLIEEKIDGMQEVTMQYLLEHVLYVPTGKQTRYESTRVGKILHALGWSVGKQIRSDHPSGRTRIYVPSPRKR